jgi:hypothetical protein
MRISFYHRPGARLRYLENLHGVILLAVLSVRAITRQEACLCDISSTPWSQHFLENSFFSFRLFAPLAVC